MFTFTPLLGAHSSSTATSSLLEFDNGIKILVDAGWDASFDQTRLEAIAKHTSSLSIILLTHATFEHLGAYAHCCKHIPGFSRIPSYATTPVVNLGRTLSTDLYKNAPPTASLLPRDGVGGMGDAPETPNILIPAPTQEEIAGYFSRIYPLKYSQPHQPIPSPFSPPLTGLTITAYGAGHTLGGTVWHLQFGMESVVYAADWNQTKENLFDGARLLESGGDEVIEPLQRPTAFVCSSRGVERTDLSAPKKRDESLISLIRATIAQGGKVLIPTDSSARLLELAYVLNATWRENMDGPHADTYKNANIYMATRSSKATLRYLQSMLEWLEPSVAQEGETAMTTAKGSVHPLHWNHVKKIERQAQVERALMRRKPSVILASDSSLEWGFSRLAVEALAADSRNLVILTETSSGWENGKSALASQLWGFYRSGEGAASAQGNVKVVNADGQTLSLQKATTEDLNSDENSLYQQYMARQVQLHSSLQGDNTMDATSTAVGDDQVEDSSDSEDEDEDAEHQGRALNLSLQMTQNKRKVGLSEAELGVNVLLRGKNVYDYDVRNKRGREKMFPFVAHRNRADEFGELIKAEDYLRAEERDDVGGAELTDAAKMESGPAATGQKRKWDDGDAGKMKQNTVKGSKKAKSVKNADEKHEPDDIDAVIARATGESGKDGAENGAAADLDISSSEDEDDDDESDYEPEDDGPKKVVFSTVEIQLKLTIAHVDFSGLAGLTDIVNIVSMMRPRKLIISAGTETETQMLAEKCQPIPEMANAEILTPRVGDTVEASMDTNAWTLKLSPELVRRLEWQTTDNRGGEMRIASVAGLLAPLDVVKKEEEEAEAVEGEEGASSKKVKLTTGSSSTPAPSAGSNGTEQQPLPLLTVPPLVSTTSAASAAHPVRVGDIRLLDLRAHLTALGHEVAVRGLGTLLVDGSVVVRKVPATGRLEVECANSGFARAKGRTMRLVGGGPGTAGGGIRQVSDMRGVFFGVREEVERALAIVR